MEKGIIEKEIELNNQGLKVYVVIKGDNIIVESFIKEFQYIISDRPAIDKMPEAVPDRPEYDRSSFKQYICEELVIRTRKRIGNARENINRANSLSPSYL